MIKFLQSGNRAAKYILAGFLLVLAASMVTYLIPGFLTDTGVTESGVLAKVGDQEIRREDVSRVAASMTRGQQVPDFYRGYLNQQALQELLRQAEVIYEAQRMGLRVSDKELRDELQNGAYKEALFPGGKWIGADQYKSLLSQYNLTPDRFEHDVKMGLLSRKLSTLVSADATVSDSEVEQAYKDQNTKVKLQYAVLQMDDVLKSIKPTDTELKAYFEANKTRYQNAIPEKRQIKYFVLNDKDLADKISVTDSDIQRYHSAHQDSYRVPERVKVRHILIETPKPGPDGKPDQKGVDAARAKAQDLLKQIKSGADFAELAKKNSQDPGSKDKGGELGWIVKGQTVAEFEKTAFAQNKGQISDPVQTSFGFHIIQTEDKEDAHVKPLSEMRPQIEAAVKQDKLGALLQKTGDDAIDAAQKQGLEKAAAKYNAQVVQSNMVARTDTLPGIGAQPSFMDAVFTTRQNAGAQSTRIPTGLVVFEVTKTEPPRSPSFEEIKDRVANEFKNERAGTLLSRKAQEMSDRAHAEHDLAKAAKEAGATVKTSDLVGRTSQIPDLGSMQGPANVAFTLKQGEISGPLNFGRGQGVVQVVERQEPSNSDPQFAQQRDQLREQLLQQKRQEHLSLFLNDLSTRMEKEGKVKINKSEMDALLKSRS